MHRFASVVLICCLLAVSGCADLAPKPQLVSVQPPPAETPVANLPVALRPYNWTDARGSGSCVHASTTYVMRWDNMLEMAEYWRNNHEGGETSTTIRRYLDAANLDYRYTLASDAHFLEWVTQTRRAAIIWYYPSHCVTFCGFAKGPNGKDYAYINDNNRPKSFIKIERSEFLRRWEGYGGFALTLTNPPIPPKLFPAYTRAT